MMEQAYRDHYGEELEVTEENAGWEFLKRLFQNNMVVMGSDDDVSQAVGGAGQTEPPIGMYTYTKHRNMEELDLALGICDTMEPFMGYALATYIAQVNGAPHPNAAKLFTHFVLTEEGVAPWVLEDLGGYSSNPEVSANPEDEIGSWTNWREYLVTFDPVAAIEMRQDLQDFWLLNSR
jgi:iron(III) transport system substrate-binding protein